MFRHTIAFIFLSFFLSVAAVGQVHTAQTSKPSAKAPANKPHNSIFFTVGREKEGAIVIDIALHAGTGRLTVGEREISVQLLAVKRTADGRVDDVAKIGSVSKMNMPATEVEAGAEAKTSAPRMIVPFVSGADSMSISVKDVANGSVKQVLLRVPPGAGTTMGEMRF